MRKDFKEEDRLIEKWKLLLPQLKITHRNSWKRRYVLGIS